MGAAVSSTNICTLAGDSSSPNAAAVFVVAQAISEPCLKQFKLTTQREFHLSVMQLHALLPSVARDTLEQAFAVFDPSHSGAVDSCELLSTLVLAAPQLTRDAKQRAIFELFNQSTHRVGLMVADEATLLFRTVAVGAAKLLSAITSQDSATTELPRLAFFEDLTKTLYGEQETLTYEAFDHLCRDTAETDEFLTQWVARDQIVLPSMQ